MTFWVTSHVSVVGFCSSWLYNPFIIPTPPIDIYMFGFGYPFKDVHVHCVGWPGITYVGPEIDEVCIETKITKTLLNIVINIWNCGFLPTQSKIWTLCWILTCFIWSVYPLLAFLEFKIQESILNVGKLFGLTNSVSILNITEETLLRFLSNVNVVFNLDLLYISICHMSIFHLPWQGNTVEVMFFI